MKINVDLQYVDYKQGPHMYQNINTKGKAMVKQHGTPGAQGHKT